MQIQFIARQKQVVECQPGTSLISVPVPKERKQINGGKCHNSRNSIGGTGSDSLGFRFKIVEEFTVSNLILSLSP